jgi:1-acyl-sn-glycerol-3-phosphate acyltransferase
VPEQQQARTAGAAQGADQEIAQLRLPVDGDVRASLDPPPVLAEESLATVGDVGDPGRRVRTAIDVHHGLEGGPIRVRVGGRSLLEHPRVHPGDASTPRAPAEGADRPHDHGGSIRPMAAGELNRWWRVGLPIVAPLVRLLFRLRISGLEHVPSGGAAILVFNHVSTLDGPVLAIETSRRSRRETRFVVAAEFFERPFFGWILRRFHQIDPARRGRHRCARARARRAEGRPPRRDRTERTVNPDPPELLRIRSGIARIALPTGAPSCRRHLGNEPAWPKAGIHWDGRSARLAIVRPPILPSASRGR